VRTVWYSAVIVTAVGLQTSCDEHSYATDQGLSKRYGQLTHKRQKHTKQWKANVRKRLRQSGHEYTSVSDRKMRAKTVKDCKPDHEGYRYVCDLNFGEYASNAVFNAIHEHRWALPDVKKERSILARQKIVSDGHEMHTTQPVKNTATRTIFSRIAGV